MNDCPGHSTMVLCDTCHPTRIPSLHRKRSISCELPRDDRPCRDGTSCPRCREQYGMDACRKSPESTPEEDVLVRAEIEWQQYLDRRDWRLT